MDDPFAFQVSIRVPSHRIVGSEVGRNAAPGQGSIRMMKNPRRRRFRGPLILIAPIVVVVSAIAGAVMWFFR